MAARKSAPLRIIERAMAVAAYEQDEEAAPSRAAFRIERGRASGSSRPISVWETTAWITPEMKKPRISGQSSSQPMSKAMARA